MQNPAQFKIPTWFLNRQKDMTDGKNLHVLSNTIDQKMRDDLERLKKIRSHRGLRHYWGLRVRGQHTKVRNKIRRVVGAAAHERLTVSPRYRLADHRPPLGPHRRCHQEEVDGCARRARGVGAPGLSGVSRALVQWAAAVWFSLVA